MIAGVGGYNEEKGYFPKTESISSCSHVDGNDPLRSKKMIIPQRTQEQRASDSVFK